jgi:hypothetical protein
MTTKRRPHACQTVKTSSANDVGTCTSTSHAARGDTRLAHPSNAAPRTTLERCDFSLPLISDSAFHHAEYQLSDAAAVAEPQALSTRSRKIGRHSSSKRICERADRLIVHYAAPPPGFRVRTPLALTQDFRGNRRQTRRVGREDAGSARKPLPAQLVLHDRRHDVLQSEPTKPLTITMAYSTHQPGAC